MKHMRTAAVLLVIAAGSLSTWVMSKSSNDGGPSASAFTLEVVKTFYKEGEPIGVKAHLVAYREDGASVLAHSYRESDGTKVEVRKIFLPAELKQYALNSLVESVTSEPMSGRSAGSSAEPPKNCGQPETAPTKVISGYKVVKVGDSKSPEGLPSTIDTWASPALRCSVLLSTLVRDGRVVSKTKVASVHVGEPDATLFLIPTRYREMSPKEYLEAADLKLGRKAGESFGVFGKIMEERYQLARGNMK